GGPARARAGWRGNRRQVGRTTKAVLLPHIKEGGLRALAVTSDQRWADLPEVPPLREAGFEGIPAYLLIGLLAPAKTPPDVIQKINAAMIDGLKTPEAQASLAKLGLETRAMTPAEFSAALADETKLWDAAIKEAGIKLD